MQEAATWCNPDWRTRPTLCRSPQRELQSLVFGLVLVLIVEMVEIVEMVLVLIVEMAMISLPATAAEYGSVWQVTSLSTLCQSFLSDQSTLCHQHTPAHSELNMNM